MSAETSVAGQRRRDLRGSRRRQRIVKMLNGGEDAVSVEELAETFGVSLATVRRDLARLRDERVITRTYGGASAGLRREQTIGQRQTTRRRAKDCIGREAARQVEPGDVIILDAGTTTEAVAANLGSVQELTVITNGLGAITRLIECDDVSITVLGGSLRQTNQTISGPQAEEMLRNVYATTVFIGADAVDPELGIASRTAELSHLKDLMMRRAERVVVVADSSKLGRDGFHYWSPLLQPWELITDEEADPEVVDLLRAAGADDVTVVELSGADATDLDLDDDQETE